MAIELPELVRGACLAEIAPGGLLPLTAFFAALGGATILRAAYDRHDPMPVGDPRESGRLLLQWGVALSLTVALVPLLQDLAGSWLVPPAAAMGPWLRFLLGADGVALVLRHGRRLLVLLRRPPAQHSSILPELDFRPPVELPDGTLPPPMPKLDAPEPDNPVQMRGDVRALLAGILMLWAGWHGWKMDSLCYLRLPEH